MKMSVVMPAYNEEATIEEIVELVLKNDLVGELIIVDDCSSDKTREIMKTLEEKHDKVKIFFHEKNQGKGAALQTGFEHCTENIVIIQDADLEYDPTEYIKLYKPIADGRADVVYGSRFFGEGAHRVHLFWHRIGNGFLTLLSNFFTNLNLTDMETCYKCFKREVIQNIPLEQKRFGFEVEITAKIAKMRCKVYEVGISYSGRDYDEGKKIGVKDGFEALFCIIKYRFKSFTLKNKK